VCHDETNGSHRAREQVAILVSQEHHGLFAMADLTLDQKGLLEVDELHAIGARDVGGSDDHDVVPGQRGIEVDALEPAAGHGRTDGAAVQHSGQDEVVDVARPPRELLDAVLPAHARADDHSSDYRPRVQMRAAAPDRSRRTAPSPRHPERWGAWGAFRGPYPHAFTRLGVHAPVEREQALASGQSLDGEVPGENRANPRRHQGAEGWSIARQHTPGVPAREAGTLPTTVGRASRAAPGR